MEWINLSELKRGDSLINLGYVKRIEIDGSYYRITILPWFGEELTVKYKEDALVLIQK